MGDDDLDLLHVSRHRGMTIDVTGPITCEFVQPGLTQWPRAGDLVPDLVADVPPAHGPYRALADAGHTHGAALESWTRWPTTLRGGGHRRRGTDPAHSIVDQLVSGTAP